MCVLSSLCRGARRVYSARYVVELDVSLCRGAKCVHSARYVVELGVCTQLAMSWS